MSPFRPDRAASITRLRSETFDVCIIGGGATGAGCALDAAARGLNTALLEADDFGALTSGTSTKLVHGGVRYLEQAVKTLDPKQLALVRKALHERRTLLRIAPHLCQPLALLTPCANLIEGWYYAIGLKVYDYLAGSRRLAPSRWLNRAEALRQFPAFSERALHSAVLYYDGQFDDVRLNLALALTAAERGAAVANHLRVVQTETDASGRLRHVVVRDALTNETFAVQARVFVNATGTHADFLRQRANPAQTGRMRASKGAHAVLPLSAMPNAGSALLVPKTADGRVLFAIPWRGNWLIGTTDTEAEPTDQPQLLPDEAQYLIEHVQPFVRVPLSTGQIRGGFAGLRPLLQAEPDASSKSVVRDHEVEIDRRSGLISIMGGKWTTYRLMAEETIDACCRALGEWRACLTETLTLRGGNDFGQHVVGDLRAQQLPGNVVEHLATTYGAEARNVVALLPGRPDLAQPLCADQPFLAAEVVYAARYELAQTLPDVLMRRIRLGIVDWAGAREALPTTSRLLATELGWSEAERQTAEADFRQYIEQLMETAGLLETKKA